MRLFAAEMAVELFPKDPLLWYKFGSRRGHEEARSGRPIELLRGLCELVGSISPVDYRKLKLNQHNNRWRPGQQTFPTVRLLETGNVARPCRAPSSRVVSGESTFIE